MDDTRRLRYLAAMGIQAWQLRVAGESAQALEQTAEPDRVQDSEQESGQTLTAGADLATGAAGVRAALKAAASRSAGRAAEAGGAETAAPPAGMPTGTAALGQRPAEAASPMQASPPQAFSPSPRGEPEPPPWLDEPPPWTDEDELPLARESDHADTAQAQVPAISTTADRDEIARMDWDALRATVAECRRCPLCETRTKTVFGVGDRHAELMFIGEGPGQDEDQQGEPFVGRAGQLLDKMLAAIGLAREQVYIANIVKCRPPRNRNPEPNEAAACRAFLQRQIALIRPKLIISLGAVSANNLLGNTDAVGRLRGKPHQYQPADGTDPIPLIVTYHPSYYLRTPAEKAKGWQDLQQIIKTLRGLH